MRSVAVALFTRDLRVHDNPVLQAAGRSDRVVPLFVLDDAAPRRFLRPNRSVFLAQCLRDLDSELRARGGRLILRRGSLVGEVCAIANEVGAAQVHLAADVSGYAQRREHALTRGLRAAGRQLVVHDASVNVVPPGELTPSGKDHFAVFTPYYRRWLEHPLRRPQRAVTRIDVPRVRSDRIPLAGELCEGSASPRLQPGGEREARRRLSAWTKRIERYADNHDHLADDTSQLSPHLHFGNLSPVEVVHRFRGRSAGADAFVRQLAWRDFHQQVLAARPDAASHDYRDRGDRWRRDEPGLEAWRTGRTGYPIVDAGMRQLASEGWMHNRARLIAASFLTKTLYVDWRLGAEHFLDLLVDADIANNQLNWQWVAGTGTDTRPHRVLNPIAQARRHDPAGDYVRRHIPELAGIDGPLVHEPWKLPGAQRERLDYPQPIVDPVNGGRPPRPGVPWSA